MKTFAIWIVGFGALVLILAFAVSTRWDSASAASGLRPGFNASTLPANDDGSTGLVPLGFTADFFGTNYTSVYVNNNGNVTFDLQLGTFTPFDLTSTNRVIIAPFFADVDTRAGNVVTYGAGTVNGRPAFGVNWPQVGCYSFVTSVLNTFQVVLVDRSDVAAGDFDFEFNYTAVQWETGQASGGNASCLGGSSARAGYSNGTGSPGTFFELAGSAVNGGFLDTNLGTGLIHNSLNSGGKQGRYLFEVRSGVPITPTPILSIAHQGNIFPVAGGSIGEGLAGPSAALSSPADIAVVDKGGGMVNAYIADTGHCTVLLLNQIGNISVVAGTGVCGFAGDGGLAIDAQLDAPTGVDVDAAGNVYIADSANCRVRQVDTSGTITTFAGDGICAYGGDGGAATSAQLNDPYDVLVDGSELLITDQANCRVRKVDAAGDIDTIAGDGTCAFGGNAGPATMAQLDEPRRLVHDASGNLYISEAGSSCRVRIIDTFGDIETFAGDGTCAFGGDGGSATSAQLDEPDGLAVDGNGDVYISDMGNCVVRVVDTIGDIDTFAGDGTCAYGGDGGDALVAQLNAPAGLDADDSKRIYVADRDNHRVRRVGSPITTIAGTGLPTFCGDGFVAIDRSCLGSPSDVSLDNAGNIYIADPDNNRIRSVNPVSGAIGTLAGKTIQSNCPGNAGSALNLCLDRPEHIVVSPTGPLLYVSERDGNRIWAINRTLDQVFLIAGTTGGGTGFCNDNATAVRDCLSEPRGIALQQVSGSDRYLFIAQGGNNGDVVRVDLLMDRIRVVVTGDGTSSADVAVNTDHDDGTTDDDGSLFIAYDTANLVKRMSTGGDGLVDGDEGAPSIVAGTGSAGFAADATVATSAELDGPVGVDVDDDGHLLISDRNNHRIYVITQGTGTPFVVDGEADEFIFRIAGTLSPKPGYCGAPKPKPDPTPSNTHNARTACLDTPGGLFYDDIDKALYFADTGNQRVRKIPSDCDDDGLTDLSEITPNPFVTEECDADTDKDGCSDSAELTMLEAFGGLRDPTYFWDFYDVWSHPPVQPPLWVKDKVVNIAGDILGVAGRFGPGPTPVSKEQSLIDAMATPTNSNGYHAAFDRGPIIGANNWNRAPADGSINVPHDILGVANQFGHDCS